MENKNEGNEKKVILGDFNPNLPGGGIKLTPLPLLFFEKCIFYREGGTLIFCDF